MGKGVGDDFRDGKMTLPVILAYARGSADEREFWRAAMTGERVADDDLAHAVTLAAHERRVVRHDRAGAPLRPPSDRCPGRVPGEQGQGRADRSGRVRGGAGLLTGHRLDLRDGSLPTRRMTIARISESSIAGRHSRARPTAAAGCSSSSARTRSVPIR